MALLSGECRVSTTLPGRFAVGLVVFMRGAAMAITEADWQAEFETWLAPFLTRLRRAEQRRWAPVYLQGLLGPGERRSVEPMAARAAPGDVQQLHHVISTASKCISR